MTVRPSCGAAVLNVLRQGAGNKQFYNRRTLYLRGDMGGAGDFLGYLIMGTLSLFLHLNNKYWELSPRRDFWQERCVLCCFSLGETERKT